MKTYRKLALLIASLLAGTLSTISVAHATPSCSLPKYRGGYRVVNQSALARLGTDTNCRGETIYQTRRIELSGWDTPIENWYGTFDGQGYEISGDSTAPLFDHPGIAITITDVHRTGNVTGGGLLGGFIGYANESDVTINASSMTGNVTGTGDGDLSGGFIGLAVNSANVTITDSYTTGDVIGDDSSGGFIGRAEIFNVITITNSYTTGIITGDVAGGFIGHVRIQSDVTISDSYTTREVTGDVVGGFIGAEENQSHVTITNSYATGQVNGDIYAGGFIGWEFSSSHVTIAYSYSTGHVTGLQYLGGFIADAELPTDVTITESFCLLVAANCGIAGPHRSPGVPLPADDLKSPTFLGDPSRGWDFDEVWCVRDALNDGFPVLRVIDFGPGDTNNCRPRKSRSTKQIATLDPAGGVCGDHSSSWTQSFRGTFTLPTATECQRDGYVFLGWTRDPARTAPEDLVTTSISRSATLTAVWGALPAAPSRVDVLANFLCLRNCTSAIVVWPASTTATDTATITINSTPATCNNSGEAFGLKWCWITGLTLKTTHTATVTWRNQYGDGPTTTATFTLN